MMMRARLPLFASVCLLLVLMSSFSVEAKKKKYVGETGGDFEFIDEVSPKWLSTCQSVCLSFNTTKLLQPVCVRVYVCVRVMWHI